MSEREELAAGMSGERCPDGGLHTPNWQDSAWVCLDCGVALVVAELRAHDDRIRADTLAPVLALADEWEHAARAIEAAALALYADEFRHRHVQPFGWAHVREDTKDHFRRKARIVLEVAFTPAPAPDDAEGKG